MKRKRPRKQKNSQRRPSATFGAHAARRGEPKLSEVLVDIAEPLLRNLPDREDSSAFQGALNTAAVLWNARLIPGGLGRSMAIAEVKKAFGGPASDAFDALFREVVDRADLFYPDLDRMISRVEATPAPGGGYTVTVASLG